MSNEGRKIMNLLLDNNSATYFLSFTKSSYLTSGGVTACFHCKTKSLSTSQKFDGDYRSQLFMTVIYIAHV
jgi:hypothetical protein